MEKKAVQQIGADVIAVMPANAPIVKVFTPFAKTFVERLPLTRLRNLVSSTTNFLVFQFLKEQEAKEFFAECEQSANLLESITWLK